MTTDQSISSEFDLFSWGFPCPWNSHFFSFWEVKCEFDFKTIALAEPTKWHFDDSKSGNPDSAALWFAVMMMEITRLPVTPASDLRLLTAFLGWQCGHPPVHPLHQPPHLVFQPRTRMRVCLHECVCVCDSSEIIRE